MPTRDRALGGRPRAPRLPPRASRIIRGELEHALIERRKPAGFLAGTAAGNQRNERTIRQDLADRHGLKVDAALFLLRRALKSKLIDYRTYFRLRAVIELCYPQSREITNARGLALFGGFFLAADLQREIMTEVEEAVPRLRPKTRQIVAKAVERALDAARDKAYDAGVPHAFAEHLRRHAVPPTLAEKRARALAYSRAREQLGDEAVPIAIEDESTLHYEDFLDD